MSVKLETSILELERIIHQDPGKRGLQPIWDELIKNGLSSQVNTLTGIAETLVSGCKKALVTTGFVIPSIQKPETDGPPGALAICRALHFLGVEVALISSPGNIPLLKAMLAYETECYGYTIPLIEAPYLKEVEDKPKWAAEVMKGYDHLISIEILGKARDGGYYNMRAIEASAFNSPIDVLWEVALQNGQAKTVSIGDGGNEIGMGNLHDLVAKYVPRGDIIGTVVKCDHLISTGVSNWGGYAIACALYLFSREKKGSADLKMLPQVSVESKLLDIMLANGAVDGPTCEATRKVDSFDFSEHEKVIESMIALCETN